MTTSSNVKPSTLTAREKDGSRLYAYDIVETTTTDENGEEQTSYTYEQVRVWEPVTANKILAAVICAKYDQSYELKLVNEYYAATNGLYEDDDEEAAKISAYTAYLGERARLKELVDSDCAELGIA